ncbi:MAG: hypothetical protein J7M39_01685, partial [Anaerolineae bacterium]|nr:hypothetical protein [Anaerolineae bacterium]
MGTGHIAAAVADAGPLIHLHEIGALTLLTIVRQLHVPDAVLHETVNQNRIDEPSIHKLCNVVRHQLDIHLIDQFIRAHQFLNPHPGERKGTMSNTPLSLYPDNPHYLLFRGKPT